MPVLVSQLSIALVVLLTCSVSIVAHAQSTDAGSFKLGETDLFPSVRIDYGQNSNAFLTSGDEKSASNITIAPELRWVADRRLLVLEGTYNGRYNVSSEDVLNYSDHRLGLSSDLEISSRKRVSADLSLNFGHQDLGTSLTLGAGNANDKPVQYADIRANAVYRYGANNAKGNLSLGLLLQSYNYTSRSDVTAGRNYSRFSPYAEFSLRLGGSTRLLSQLRFASFQFENDNNRNDLSFLTGLQFDATGKTGGSVRFGVLQSQPDSGNDQTEFVLRASLFWEPTTFSRFTLEGRRSLDNTGSSFVNANSVTAIEDLYTLTWRHSWSSRVSHLAVLQSNVLERACPDRDQVTIFGRLEFNVQIRRWLSVGVGGRSSSRSVDDCAATEPESQNLDYQRTQYGAHIRATL